MAGFVENITKNSMGQQYWSKIFLLMFSCNNPFAFLE